MTDIETIKSSNPEEELLCELIETDLMGIVLDECCTEDQLARVINAVSLYKRAYDGRIRIYIVGNDKNTPYIRKLMAGYGTAEEFEFINADDGDRLLTRFLGSEALITSDRESSCTRLAKEFYLPRLCLSEGMDFHFEDGVLYIGSEPSAISAALMVIKERKFTDELSGHKRLV